MIVNREEYFTKTLTTAFVCCIFAELLESSKLSEMTNKLEIKSTTNPLIKFTFSKEKVHLTKIHSFSE